MKKIISILLALAILLSVMPNIALAEDFAGAKVAFYVAPDGNDANEGTIDAPLATLKGARDKVRAYKAANGLPEGGINVYFRGGMYEITDTTSFEKEDSGAENSPISYKAYPGEEPIFTGGYYVESSKFQTVTDDAVLSRLLSQEAKGKIVQFDLKANGITNYGEMYDSCGWGADGNSNGFGNKIAQMEVYIDDAPCVLSRWPNRKEDGTNDYVYTGKSIAYGRKGTSPADELPVFEYKEDRVEKWSSYKDVCTLGFYKADYADDNVKLLAVDKENKTITLKTQLSHGVLENKKYLFYNVFDEMDAPGEYYIDRQKGILYLYPTDNFEQSTVKLSYFDKPLVIECKDLSFVNFSGLTFELVRGSVFRIVGGDSVTIAYCTVKNIGIYAALIGKSSVGFNPDLYPEEQLENGKSYDNNANGVNHKVMGCEFFNLGYGGVNMTGGDMMNLVPAGYEVENCKMHNFSIRRRAYVNGVTYNGYGMRIAHNEIFNAPHAALCGGALGMVIEYNNIYDVVKETEDAGAIYTNYTLLAHDLHIRYNYIHDIRNSEFGHKYAEGIVMRPAIYVDTEYLSPDIYGNIIVNCPVGFFGAVKNEKVKNNIFIDCLRPIGAGGKDCHYLRGYTGKEALEHSPNEFGYISSYPYKLEPWKSAYPEFYNFMMEFEKMDNAMLWTGEWVKNIMYFDKKKDYFEQNQPSKLITSDGDEYTYEDNILTFEDPGFVDAENENYNLKENAYAYDVIPDFEPLNFDKMGLLTERVGAKVNDAVVLQLGTPNALVNGELKSVDKDNLAVMPAVVNDRTLVPVRFISESFGGVVGWDEETQTVTIDIAGRQVKLVIGDNKLVVDGTVTEMDVTADTINDRTMIPLRALAEVALGKNVFWDDRGLIVISDGEALNNETDADLITEMINSLIYR